jgi:hypothetical protein
LHGYTSWNQATVTVYHRSVLLDAVSTGTHQCAVETCHGSRINSVVKRGVCQFKGQSLWVPQQQCHKQVSDTGIADLNADYSHCNSTMLQHQLMLS